jgi:hypothetical protein
VRRHLTRTVEVDRDDLADSPVTQPETTVVPPWRLTDRETGEKHAGLGELRHGTLLAGNSGTVQLIGNR